MTPIFNLRTLAALSAILAASASEYQSEILRMEGHTVLEDYRLSLPIDYVDADTLPDDFSWGNVNGTSFLTHSLNQHIPHYCGSCWAHAALSAFGDRIKIARKAQGVDINLSIQYILNCGNVVAGSCHGGTVSGTYDFIKQKGNVPYDTCLSYVACSAESKEGFCSNVDSTCTAKNTCRTCSTFSDSGGKCVGIEEYPNATISEYGMYHWDAKGVMAEIYKRGPVATGINAEPLLDYQGGIVKDHNLFHKMPNHVVSIVGWGTDKATAVKYWIIRNSWGEYWGEMGYAKIELGRNVLGIESEVAWATPGKFTVVNTHCDEDGINCGGRATQEYIDPALLEENISVMKQRNLRRQQ